MHVVHGLYIECAEVTPGITNSMKIEYCRIGLRRFWAPSNFDLVWRPYRSAVGVNRTEPLVAARAGIEVRGAAIGHSTAARRSPTIDGGYGFYPTRIKPDQLKPRLHLWLKFIEQCPTSTDTTECPSTKSKVQKSTEPFRTLTGIPQCPSTKSGGTRSIEQSRT
jgi:hypothetical protein